MITGQANKLIKQGLINSNTPPKKSDKKVSPVKPITNLPLPTIKQPQTGGGLPLPVDKPPQTGAGLPLPEAEKPDNNLIKRRINEKPINQTLTPITQTETPLTQETQNYTLPDIPTSYIYAGIAIFAAIFLLKSGSTVQQARV